LTLQIWQSVVLGVVEGVTEFLPVSSTGHLTIAEKLLGLQIDDASVTGFTAVIQLGAILAAIIYFAKDIWRMLTGVVRGTLHREHRRDFDFRLAWYVLAGSIPIGVVGFLGKSIIAGPLRSLWVVATALIAWSAVMVLGENFATQHRGEKDVNLADGLIIGLAQCVALYPGVSRSGATISIGLLRGLDRVTATRLSFFLGIPALTAAGLYELKDALSGATVGVVSLAIGTAVSFVVAYASIAWLLRFVAHHSIVTFVWYRVLLGAAIIVALATNFLSAT
jgi:undecaprenyl-diphosphatase